MPEVEVVRLPANVDTDAIVPGPYLRLPNREILPHLFENLDPGLRERLGPGTVIWAGPSFGCGSSRESAAACLRMTGIEAVIAPSFGWIFYRNAVNVGLAVYRVLEPCPVEDGGRIHLDPAAGEVVAAGRRLAIRNRHGVAMDILAAGGLVPYLKARGDVHAS
ncbi:MAG: 3-isopropylmalate dehydratase [Firmicutes bacterium]|nr:3-isopropylmalate dehydratase [Bacillota bacterium]